MIVTLPRRMFAVACDVCHRQCPDSVQPTGHAARRVANAAGWVKSGRRAKRCCPDCRGERQEGGTT